LENNLRDLITTNKQTNKHSPPPTHAFSLMDEKEEIHKESISEKRANLSCAVKTCPLKKTVLIPGI
jgi:hypothetical protein